MPHSEAPGLVNDAQALLQRIIAFLISKRASGAWCSPVDRQIIYIVGNQDHPDEIVPKFVYPVFLGVLKEFVGVEENSVVDPLVEYTEFKQDGKEYRLVAAFSATPNGDFLQIEFNWLQA